MRAFAMPLMFATVIVTLQACSHSAVTRAATPTTAGTARAASDANDRVHAKRLVWDKFAAEGVNVGIVDLRETTKPRVYDYVCDYDVDFPGQFCFYTAKGQVDLATEGVTVASREREDCHPLDARAR